MAVRNVKTDKKWMTCLRCGMKIYTDVFHRLCRRCRMRNAEVSHRVGRVSRDVVSIIRRSGFDELF